MHNTNQPSFDGADLGDGNVFATAMAGDAGFVIGRDSGETTLVRSAPARLAVGNRPKSCLRYAQRERTQFSGLFGPTPDWMGPGSW